MSLKFSRARAEIAAMKFARLLAAALGIIGGLCHAADEKAPAIKRAKAAISTPLFILPTGANMLAEVTLTATATPVKSAAPATVAFVPPLGPAGKSVLDSVSKYLAERHHGWPVGQRIEITFSVPVAPDDAAAAGLATATVLDSMLGDWEADPACAVVGFLQADGKIVSVTGALARLLTAMRAGASRILLPEKNVAEAAADVMINEGPAAFGRVQMFAVKDLDEVPMMAGAKLEPHVAQSIAAFDETQKELAAAGKDAAGLLKKTDTQESLRTVLEKWPNHISARLLLGHSIGRYKTFSLAGSAQVVDRTAATLLAGINSGQPQEVRKLPPERIDAELTALRNYADRIDPIARPLITHLIAYGEAAQTWQKQPPPTQAEAAALGKTLPAEAAQVQAERKKLARSLLK